MHARARVALAILVMAAASPSWGQAYATAGTEPYRVECTADVEGTTTCRTDLATFLGKRTFDEYCASCHARDALGSTFAPSLVERVQGLERAQFMRLLERGYGGEAAPMTRWADVPGVRTYSDALWTYLSARAQGELPAGPISLLPDASSP